MSIMNNDWAEKALRAVLDSMGPLTLILSVGRDGGLTPKLVSPAGDVILTMEPLFPRPGNEIRFDGMGIDPKTIAFEMRYPNRLAYKAGLEIYALVRHLDFETLWADYKRVSDAEHRALAEQATGGQDGNS